MKAKRIQKIFSTTLASLLLGVCLPTATVSAEVGENNYAYSFAVVGDPQIITESYPDKVHYIYDWILENKESKNIQFAFNLGDSTNIGATAEWQLISSQIKRLDDIIPYSIIRGNHDDILNYDTYFKYQDYADTLSGTFDGTMKNTYQKFSIGNIKYMVVALDLGASDAVLGWADRLISLHGDYNVIVTTHAYLKANGQYLTGTKTRYGAYNDGDEIFDKLIKKHENIVMTLCGHDPHDYVLQKQSTGENGNVIQELLVNPQGLDKANGANGLVAMLYFSADGKTVDVEYYNTITGEEHLPDNAFSFELNVIEATDSVHSYCDWTQIDTYTVRECTLCGHLQSK